eukprot:SM000070S21309  [mRNA]  locus=s70:257284:259005:+ [translate_table: standard]
MESDQGKLFIGGISWETTEEKLREHFQAYGEVVDTVIMKDRATGRARGFGFVVFSDPEVADRVVLEKHTIDGRQVEAKKAVPRDEQNSMARGSGGPNSGGGIGGGGGGGPGGGGIAGGGGAQGVRTKKIFVGGLASSVTEDDFRKYFEQFGNITDVVVMYDHNTQRPRGFGFITYDSEDAVDAVLQKNFHELNEKMVEVKRAVPKELSQPGGSTGRGSAYGGRGGGYVGSYGYGTGAGGSPGSYGGRGDRYGQAQLLRGGYGYGSSYGGGAYGDTALYGTANGGYGADAYGAGGYGSLGYGATAAGSYGGGYGSPAAYGASAGGRTSYGGGYSSGAASAYGSSPGSGSGYGATSAYVADGSGAATGGSGGYVPSAYGYGTGVDGYGSGAYGALRGGAYGSSAATYGTTAGGGGASGSYGGYADMYGTSAYDQTAWGRTAAGTGVGVGGYAAATDNSINGSAAYSATYGVAGRQTQRGQDARFRPYPTTDRAT